MIPSWILELVGFAAAHASDDHGATCPTHADPAAECLCGLSEAQAVLANVPEAVKGVALRAVPIAYDYAGSAGAVVVDFDLSVAAEEVRTQLNAAVALGVVTSSTARVGLLGSKLIFQQIALDMRRFNFTIGYSVDG